MKVRTMWNSNVANMVIFHLMVLINKNLPNVGNVYWAMS